MIRPAKTADAPAITELWNWMIGETLSTFTSTPKAVPEIEALIDARPNACFVAESPQGCAGFVTFGPFRGGNGYAHTCEHSIIVSPQMQGSGIGRALMDAALSAAKAKGQHVMVAAISSANPAAAAFHAHLGFAEAGRLAQVGRKNDQWLDLILMQKMLADQG